MVRRLAVALAGLAVLGLALWLDVRDVGARNVAAIQLARHVAKGTPSTAAVDSYCAGGLEARGPGYLCLAYALHSGDVDRAYRELAARRGSALWSQYRRWAVDLAGEARDKGDLATALRYYEMLYALSPGDASAFGGQLNMLYGLSAFERARALLAAAERDGTFSPVRIAEWWGNYYVEREDWAAAERIFRSLLAVEEHRVSGLGKLAGLAWRRGDYEAAIALYEQVASADPDSATHVHGLIGAIYLNYLSAPDRALPYLESYARAAQGRDRYQTLVTLAQAYASVRRETDARVRLREAIALAPERTEAICGLVRLAVARRDGPGLSALRAEFPGKAEVCGPS